jgi:phage protein D
MMDGDAALPVNIYQGQDFYVPAFLIKVQNRELRQESYDIVSVTYSDSLTNIDSFDMTVNNWDDEATGFTENPFKYSDEDTFLPWKEVEVQMGYFRDGQDERRLMLTGEITTMTPSFPQSGAPTLAVRGLNLLHRFRTKQVTRPYFAKTDTEIAQDLVEEIAKEIRQTSKSGLQLKLDEEDVKRNRDQEQKIEYLLVHDQSPISFLMQRARDIGYEITIEEPPPGRKEVRLHFRKTSDVKRKTYVLEWGKSLISFQPTLQVARQLAEVTVRGWNPKTKKPITVTVKRSEIPGVVTPSQLGVSEPELSKKTEIVVDRPIESEAEAKLLATSMMRRNAEVMVEAKGKTVGVPDLRAGVKVLIQNLGRRFSGIYLVTSTTHTIGEGGYTTDFSARMETL